MATKLVEWLFGGFLILGFWTTLLTNVNNYSFLKANYLYILNLPIIIVLLFGIYALSVILWRVYSFNDCEEASKELMAQILEATEDLKSKGFVFQKKESS